MELGSPVSGCLSFNNKCVGRPILLPSLLLLLSAHGLSMADRISCSDRFG